MVVVTNPKSLHPSNPKSLYILKNSLTLSARVGAVQCFGTAT